MLYSPMILSRQYIFFSQTYQGEKLLSILLDVCFLCHGSLCFCNTKDAHFCTLQLHFLSGLLMLLIYYNFCLSYPSIE